MGFLKPIKGSLFNLDIIVEDRQVGVYNKQFNEMSSEHEIDLEGLLKWHSKWHV